MSAGAFRDRQQALENEFFHHVDKKLIDQLRKAAQDEESRKKLLHVTGLHDEELLQELVDKGFSAESLSALSLVPVVLVAWSDGSVDESERSAILTAADNTGIEDGSLASELLNGWLSERPPATLLETWSQYVAGLKSTLSATAFEALKTEIIQHSTDVATASGGVLGLFGKISQQEKSVLDRIENAFE